MCDKLSFVLKALWAIDGSIAKGDGRPVVGAASSKDNGISVGGGVVIPFLGVGSAVIESSKTGSDKRRTPRPNPLASGG